MVIKHIFLIKKKYLTILGILFFSVILQLYSQEKFSYPGGEFKGEKGNWTETVQTGEEIPYIETARDKYWVTLYQKDSEKTITIPLQGGQAFVAEDQAKKKWKPIFIIRKTKELPQKEISNKLASTKSEKTLVAEEENPIDYKSTCISREEAELIKYLLKYRGEKKLSTLKVSKSLTHIARLHARDLSKHPRNIGCLLQSWSSSGNWTSCCYTSDHKNLECMLNKPLELTDYKSKGYEIAYQAPQEKNAEPKIVFETWKNSLGNSSVISDTKGWETKEWKSFGVGIYKEYAVIWLGTKLDPEPVPGVCNNTEPTSEKK